MKKSFYLLGLLALLKLVVHLLGNRNYGFHRDELLHLSVSEHLAFGYMEFPPMIAWIGKLSYWFFDYSLLGVRLFPTLAGIAILILCGLMAKAMGGKIHAVMLAGIAVLAFLPYYRNHTLFQPVAFDQLWWTIGFYFLIQYINSEHKKHLLFIGLTAGLGLLTKYTFAVWGLGLVIGLLFYKKGRLFRSKWLYVSGLLAFMMLLPNIIWQARHDFPFLLHLQILKEKQLDDINPLDFGLTQLEFPFTLLLSLIGLYAVLADRRLKKYRAAGVAFMVIFATMWILQSKSYYFFAAYPVMFAAGAVKIDQWLEKKTWINYVIAAVLLLPSIPFIPMAAPVLPIETYVEYAEKEEKNGRVELTGDYADMFGWTEQVALVDSVYQSLSEVERQNCVLWAENYGEAGALKILGDQYGLPDPISRHGSFWLWGYGNPDAAVWISLGNEPPSVNHVFEEVELIRMVYHKYAIGEENGIPLYLCRKPKVDIPRWWADYEKHVFD